MAVRSLGKTGFSVPLLSLGGQGTLEKTGVRNEALGIIERAFELGVRYFDTAPTYGPSEDYLGEALVHRRGEVFLATKTMEREAAGAWRLLEASLRRLRSDQVDLWQLHDVRTEEELSQVFRPGGALEALLAAREQGLARFVGITGHYDPAVLEEAIRRFPFDCVLLALNAADVHRRPFQRTLLPLANRLEMGVVAMKVMARGGLAYGPLRRSEALGYVWSLPVSTAIVGCDSVAQVEANVESARRFEPLSERRRSEIEALAGNVVDQAAFFKRK